MAPLKQSIMLVAGEPSGDLLGARLIAALRRASPRDLDFIGVGGAAMAAEGLQSILPLSDLSVMGLTEVVPRIPRLLGHIRRTTAFARRERPAVIVTIDAPGFNFRLAKRLRGGGIPIIHYVAPTVWAWRPGRAKAIAPLFEHLLVLLIFFYGTDNTRDTVWLFRSIVWLVIVGNVITVVDVFNIPDLGLISEREDGRVGGTFGSSNEYGVFLALFLPSIFAIYMTSTGLKKLLSGVGAAVSCLAFLAQRRSSPPRPSFVVASYPGCPSPPRSNHRSIPLTPLSPHRRSPGLEAPLSSLRLGAHCQTKAGRSVLPSSGPTHLRGRIASCPLPACNDPARPALGRVRRWRWRAKHLVPTWLWLASYFPSGVAGLRQR
ncbi:MAG: hypothetical protein IIB66_05735 [Proteobacteria bacterium]|nr:hypothetical protein [Pseudomonadota bacterium]